MEQKQIQDLLIDEFIIGVCKSDIVKALDDAGFKSDDETVNKIITAKLIKQLESNTRNFVKEELQYLIDHHWDQRTGEMK